MVSAWSSPTLQNRRASPLDALGRLLPPEPLAADAEALDRVRAVEVPALGPDLDQLAPPRPACVLEALDDGLLERARQRGRVDVRERARDGAVGRRGEGGVEEGD